jgi:putative ABC transport system permease protein
MGHLQIAARGAFDAGADAGLDHPLANAAAIETALRADPSVVEVLPRLDFVGLLTNGARSVPALGIGVDPGPEARAMDQPKTLAAGRWLAGRDERAVVLGTGLAKSLDLKVGDGATLLATTADGTLNAVDAEVVGLADLPIKELDDRYLATSLGLASDLLAAEGRVSRIVVVLRDHRDAGAARGRFLRAIGGPDGAVEARTWEELAQFYRQVRTLYLGIFGFMGAVLVAIVLLATANTMLMAAAERTREIGTLRALGTRPGTVRRLFLAEGVLLALVGCAAGAVLSLALRLALNHSGLMLPPPPGATHGSPLHVKFYGVAYAAGTAAMIATLALSSWFPARRATRMRIVEALTHV